MTVGDRVRPAGMWAPQGEIVHHAGWQATHSQVDQCDGVVVRRRRTVSEPPAPLGYGSITVPIGRGAVIGSA